MLWLERSESAVLYPEDGVGGVGVEEDGVEVRAVGVGDEDLAEGWGAYQFYYVFYAVGVELVEDVVQQQQGRGGRDGLAQEVELGQFECNDVCLGLSLAAFTSDGIRVDEHLEVVAVYAV